MKFWKFFKFFLIFRNKRIIFFYWFDFFRLIYLIRWHYSIQKTFIFDLFLAWINDIFAPNFGQKFMKIITFLIVCILKSNIFSGFTLLFAFRILRFALRFTSRILRFALRFTLRFTSGILRFTFRILRFAFTFGIFGYTFRILWFAFTFGILWFAFTFGIFGFAFRFFHFWYFWNCFFYFWKLVFRNILIILD